MKNHKIKCKNYSIVIGRNAIKILPREIKNLCPNTRNIALIVDKKIPKKFKERLKKILRSYNLSILDFNASEKNKSIKTVNYFLKNLLSKNFNRSDLIRHMVRNGIRTYQSGSQNQDESGARGSE